MILVDFMMKKKMAVNSPEAQAFVYYQHVTVNGDFPRSPFSTMNEGDVVTLIQYNTETRQRGDVQVETYKGESDGQN